MSCPITPVEDISTTWQTEYKFFLGSVQTNNEVKHVNDAYSAIPPSFRQQFVWYMNSYTEARLSTLDGNPLAMGKGFMRGLPVRKAVLMQNDVVSLRYDPSYAKEKRDTVTLDDSVIQGGPKEFTVKDSGQREEYPSGMRRDTQEGKPDYTLIDPVMLERWAAHMTKGAVKYGRENWRMANSQEELTRFRASAFRHFMQWLNGEIDEDHAAAVMFNITSAEYVKKRINEG